MSYLEFTGPFAEFKHEDKWKKALNQIHESDFHKCHPSMQNVSHPIEVKALHIFTFASRFLNSVDLLRKYYRTWKVMFVEASILLYPAIEIIGSGVKARESDNKLKAGLHWLCDPKTPPNNVDDVTTKLKSVHKHMPSDQGTPTVGALYQLRNYYLHGIGRSNDSQKTKEEDIISYILPKGIAGAIEDGLYSYWENLTHDNGQQDWVNRLAKADIHPFIIRGGADSGLIDPNIVDSILSKNLRPNKSDDVS